MTDRLVPVQGDDGALAVRGGVGGIRFQWEELEHAAHLLASLAADTRTVSDEIGHLSRDVGLFPWRMMHLQPGGGVAGPLHQGVLAEIDAAWAAAMDNAETLAATGNQLTASLGMYRAADRAVLGATEAARAATGSAARTVACASIERGVLDVGPVSVRKRSVDREVPFDGTVEGIVHRLIAVEGEDPGTFEVLRAGTDDEPVYVVVLPGTQAGPTEGTAGSNPFDIGGIAEALGQDSRFTEGAVLEALEHAGAGPGDALVLTGYSQGGLHAVNLAGSEVLGARYDVQLVVTVGSPTGWHATGTSEYLHMEHRDDAVPGLDATDNGDERHRTTVTLANPVPALGLDGDGSQEAWGLGPAHKLANYAEGAKLIDSADAPSLVPAAALLATAGATGTARRHSFTAVRAPRPPGATGTGSVVGPQKRGSRLWP